MAWQRAGERDPAFTCARCYHGFKERPPRAPPAPASAPFLEHPRAAAAAAAARTEGGRDGHMLTKAIGADTDG